MRHSPSTVIRGMQLQPLLLLLLLLLLHRLTSAT
jgi:hypothetical protein